MCSHRGCKCEWKIIDEMLESSLKNKSQSHLLEEIFQPPNSQRHEILLSHGVWGSPFKRPPTVCPKTVSSLLRESI